MLREKFIAINVYIKKESSQLNNLIFNLKKLKEGKQTESKARTKEIIRSRA